MTSTIINKKYHSTITSYHPYVTGGWTPVTEEVECTEFKILEGKIPTDINGMYIRNTENPLLEPLDRYHPFDGDGMIHTMRIANGKLEYRNKFVKTKGFEAEQKAGKSLWTGLAGNPKKMQIPPDFNGNNPGAHGFLKDAASTDIVVHNNEILALFYQCGDAYRLSLDTLDTLGVSQIIPKQGISAHAEVDAKTNELLFFNYSKKAPFMNYGIVNSANKLVHYIPVTLPGSRLPHSFCFTHTHTIINDFPLFWDPQLLEKNVMSTRYYPDLPSRFGILPRYGFNNEIQWFETSPTYVLHFLNAYNDIDPTTGHAVVVMDGYFQKDPFPTLDQPHLKQHTIDMKRMLVFVDMESFKPKLWRWTFDLATGKATEKAMDNQNRNLEFGTFNHQFMGDKYRYAYSVKALPGWFLFTGYVKHDLLTGQSWSIDLPPNCFGSEAPFAPRQGDGRDEDDGYLISFVTNMNNNTSECVWIDCHKKFEIVCRVLLPHRISSGTHSHYHNMSYSHNKSKI